jgi:hypothetical protein
MNRSLTSITAFFVCLCLYSADAHRKFLSAAGSSRAMQAVACGHGAADCATASQLSLRKLTDYKGTLSDNGWRSTGWGGREGDWKRKLTGAHAAPGLATTSQSSLRTLLEGGYMSTLSDSGWRSSGWNGGRSSSGWRRRLTGAWGRIRRDWADSAFEGGCRSSGCWKRKV